MRRSRRVPGTHPHPTLQPKWIKRTVGTACGRRIRLEEAAWSGRTKSAWIARTTEGEGSGREKS